MSGYDFLMIAVLIAAMVFGAWKGLAWQIASLASLIVSYFVALQFSSQLAPYLSEKEPMNRFLAMLIIYIGCSILIWLAFRMVSGLIGRMQLKEFDRQMGALVGLAKGALLCVAITFFAVTLIEDPYRKSIMTSQSGRVIGYTIDRADAIMPEEIHDVLHPYLHRLDSQLQHDHLDYGRSSHFSHDDDHDDSHDPVPAAINFGS